MKNYIKDYYKKIDTEKYYDEFSKIYENKRKKGYHKMLDDFELAILSEFLNKTDKVLEIGCGTGLILKETDKLVSRAVGIDISSKMLEKAKQRGLEVYKAEASLLPFNDNYFDVVYSFKVLSHIEAIEKTIHEINRVLKPGGIAVLEFYNRNSMRTFLKKVKPGNVISGNITDNSVYTRYDTLKEIKYYMPGSLKIVKIKGIRVITPAFFVHNIPFVKDFFYKTEFFLKDTPLSRFAGFLVVIAEKERQSFDKE